MGERGAVAAAARVRPLEHTDARDAETTAWLLALGVAAIAVPLLLLLAKPFGLLFYGPLNPALVWSALRPMLLPEPEEQGGYLLLVLAACVLAIGILLGAPAARFLHNRPRLAAVGAARWVLVLLVGASVAGQYALAYQWAGGTIFRSDRCFTPATLVVGGLIAMLVFVLLAKPAFRSRLARVVRESSAKRRWITISAIALTALWMLHAVNSDASFAWTPPCVRLNMAFASDETFAVVNGRTPLVDFQPLYATLWPFAAAVPLLLLGRSLLVFTATMAAITSAALLAVFGVLRRVTGTSAGALLLYLPFLATSLFLIEGTPGNRCTPATYFADFPLRYAGPLLLAWLTARKLEGVQRRSLWPLFVVAGLVAVNNSSFGVPAVAATCVALALTGSFTLKSRLRLGRDAAVGLLLALSAISLLTLLRAAALPRFGQLLEFPRFFLHGYQATRIQSVLGVHLLMYLTYAAAIAVAAVRARNREPNAALTGMLAWSGIFGFSALDYFVTESGELWLKGTFAAWALALVLLGCVVVRKLARSAPRWPGLPELAVLFGLGVMTCSLAQLPPPWTQLQRLTAHRAPRPFVPEPAARPFLASLADGDAFYLKRGTPVAFLMPNGHRIADAYGVVNVSRYTDVIEMFGPSFLRTVIADLRRAGGNTVVTPAGEQTASEMETALFKAHFGLVTADGIVGETSDAEPRIRWMNGEALEKWVDLSHLHPRALRSGPRTLVERMRRPPPH